MNTPANTSAIAHRTVRDALDVIRQGTESAPDGKLKQRPKHIVDRDVFERVREHLLSRGELFRAPYPYYLDRCDLMLTRVDSIAPKFAKIFRELGLLPKQRHTDIVAQALMQEAELAEERPLHRMSYMSLGETPAIYLRRSEASMLKFTIDNIEEVPLATDGVVLLGDDLTEWPPLEQLQPAIDELRPLIGKTCTRLVKGLPFTELLTTRWSKEATFTPQQAHHMFLARLMFTAVASQYSLWPLLMLTGPQNSGKSTPFECILAMLHGRNVEPGKLPGKEADFLASATNRSYLVYDNIDDLDACDYDNTLCHLATGAEADIRVLYKTNCRATFRLRNHAAFTARVNPFSRSDVMRRMITLEVRPAKDECSSPQNKDKLIKRVLEHRNELLAEYILRAQNILAAHVKAAHREYTYQSQMGEYEAFTLRCAEYEDAVEETRGLWTASMQHYEHSLTTSNPMVHAIRLWLGAGANAGRTIAPASLYTELQALHRDLGQEFFLKSPSSFGKNIAKHESALRVLGLSFVPTRGGRDYIFSPAADELKTCASLVAALRATT